ncbi:hypothetical protein QAD02_004868 [Eretmocerus hayati]|uniref:Uncharacterized protein n=1 Tax=Eretmocerus hayati TaxID=131215 RepID=A0ACC2NRV3_9HYME|nr:hypothetical protein QAD02_004868 [Eretmocerus hayati]
MSNHPESLEKLQSYREDLRAQEDCLKKSILKINAQIHALQVEQLHILGSINKKQSENPKVVETVETKAVAVPPKVVDPSTQELDLRIRHYLSSEEDDDDMEDQFM